MSRNGLLCQTDTDSFCARQRLAWSPPRINLSPPGTECRVSQSYFIKPKEFDLCKVDCSMLSSVCRVQNFRSIVNCYFSHKLLLEKEFIHRSLILLIFNQWLPYNLVANTSMITFTFSSCLTASNSDLLCTVEPCYKRGPWDHENYLVISGFSLYQGKKTKKYKELGPAKLPCYKRVLL